MTPRASIHTGSIRLLEARRVVPPMTQFNYLIKLLCPSIDIYGLAMYIMLYVCIQIWQQREAFLLQTCCMRVCCQFAVFVCVTCINVSSSRTSVWTHICYIIWMLPISSSSTYMDIVSTTQDKNYLKTSPLWQCQILHLEVLRLSFFTKRPFSFFVLLVFKI